MRKCRFEELIDDYMLNRLSPEGKAQFEEHIFSCPLCFKKLEEREAVFSVVKDRGRELFKDTAVAQSDNQIASFRQRLFAALSLKQWAAAAAVAVGIVALSVLPSMKTSSPQFLITDGQVRGGGTVTLISPVIDIGSAPSQFKWKHAGEEIDYKLYLYHHDLLWSGETTEDFIELPVKIQNRMIIGESYSWQVKAFSQEGTLIAVSSKLQFTISNRD